MKVLDDVCEVLEAELREIVRTGDMSPTVLDNTYKAVDIIKDIKTIHAMEDASYGNSYGGSYMMPDDDYSMARGGNYNNNRNMGRYYGMGRYSRADEKEQLLAKMEEMKRQLDGMK